jgi:hypothetical protein
MHNLSSKTVKELKAYAQENNVDLDGAKTKAQILSVLIDNENLTQTIKADEPVKRQPVSASGENDNGVVISKPADNHLKKNVKLVGESQEEKEKVAIHSIKSMRWHGVGQVFPGYNIVTKEEAEKWESVKGVRLATPEEVASYYGKN